MALHRDILWIGRQWAVTGHGMQLIDQRLMGDFDIEVARLWDEDVVAGMRARAWLNAADFDTALSVARSRHQRPGAAPGAAEIVEPPSPAVVTEVEPAIAIPAAVFEEAQERDKPPPVSIEPPGSPDLQIRASGKARFASPWRVWMKRKS
jgi:hypothetical protein